MGEIRFRTRLEKRGPAAAVVLDDDQMAAVGEGAKREEARQRRVTQAIDMIRAGKTRS